MRWVNIACGLVAGAQCFAASAQSDKALVFPDSKDSLETLHRKLAGVGVGAVQNGVRELVILPDSEAFVIKTNVRSGGASRVESFGEMLDSKRVPIGRTQASPKWRSAFFAGSKLYLFDGAELAFIEADGATYKELTRRSLPWDLIKPPRDRGGEAPPQETAALRARFKRQVLATPGTKIMGLARLPDSWEKGKSIYYLAASRIKGFPLLLLECRNDGAAQCILARQCYLEGAADLTADGIVGIAISEARRLVLIGDAKKRRLVGFRYQSCYRVARTHGWSLPAKMKALTNLNIDDEDGLWLTAGAPDDYTQASLYRWPQGGW